MTGSQQSVTTVLGTVQARSQCALRLLHPTPEGYRVMAEPLAPRLAAVLG
ncbi:MAG: hypothetical protein L0H74_12580 [Brachybacterium sp.]|nr:hypothetical protein [Brachybacterium sp.]